MKKPGKALRQISVLVCATLLSYHLFALPEGGSVVAGSANINQPDAKTLLIHQSSDKAIINWNQFNIAADELTRFVVPQSSSVTLNRITGGVPSEILGLLQSNGQLWLINPNGIIFGPNAQVNVAGLIASTMNIQNEDFMKGNYQLQGVSNGAKIVNQGNIVAGDNGLIALLAPQVENKGILAANLGSVAIGTGNRATLNIAGNQLLNFSVDQGTVGDFYDTAGNRIASVKNSGQIIANGGTVLITAKNIDRVLNQSINTSGLIEANTANMRQGKIVLSGAGDTMVTGNAQILAKGESSGQKGGEVQILGKRVGLTDQASINTSGSAGGGKVLVGGDYQGKNAAIQNAEATFMGSGTTINASATEAGQGGDVIVWADGNTQFYGSIYSQGGPLGGNGGLVETSGKIYLEAEGYVNTLAPNGLAGTWLLDPANLTIVPGSTNSNVSPVSPFVPTGVNSQLSLTTLMNALATGNVTVQTGADAFAGEGDLFVSAPINFNNVVSRTLTLNAYRNLVINQIITDTGSPGALNLVLLASQGINGGTLDVNAAINLQGSLTASSGINGGTSGNIDIGAVTLSAAQGIDLSAYGASGTLAFTNSLSTLTASAGDVNLNVGSGSVVLSNINAGGDVTLNIDSGDISQLPTTAITASSGTLTANITGTPGTISLEQNNNVGAVSFSGFTAGSGLDALRFRNTGTGTLTLGTITADSSSEGNLIILASGNIAQNGIINAGSGTGNVTLQTFNGGVVQDNAAGITNANEVSISTTNGVVNLGGQNNSFTGALFLDDTNPVDLTLYNAGYTSTLPPIDFTGGTYANFSFTAPNVTGAADLDTFLNGVLDNINDPGTFNLLLNLPAYTNQLILNSRTVNNLNLTMGGETTLSAVNVGGNLNINTSGNNANITNASGNTVTGTSLFNAGTGNVIFNSTDNVFTGAVSASGYDVNLGNNGDLLLGTVTASNNFWATAAMGDLTQSGPLTVGNVATLNAGNSIVLNNTSNNFSSLVATAGTNVSLTDTNGFSLSQLDTNGDVNITVNAGGNNDDNFRFFGSTLNVGSNTVNITNLSTGVVAANRPAISFEFGTLTAGNLNLTTNSSGISNFNDSSLLVSGTTTINASGSDNNLLFDSSSNQLGTLVITSAGNANITNQNALTLGASTLSGNLTIVSGGALTQSGDVSTGDYINLSGTSIANNAELTSSTGGISLNATNGSITQGVGGSIINPNASTTLTATGASSDILLTNTANDFGDLAAMNAGRHVSLTDTGNFNLLGDITAGGNISLRVNASGTAPVTQETLTIATILNANSGAGNISLTNDATNVGTGVAAITYSTALTGNNISLSSASGGIAAQGSGLINSTGTTTITALDGALDDGNNVSLLGPSATEGNNFNNLMIVDANTVDVSDVNGLIITGITNATGNVTVTANTNDANTGLLQIAGNIAAGTNSVTLNNASTAFSAATNAISQTSGTITAGNVNINTFSGAIAQSGGSISSSDTFTTNSLRGGAISFTGANDFNNIVVNNFAITPGSVSLSDVNGFTILSAAVSGLTATANTVTTNNGQLIFNDINAGTGTVNLTNSSTVLNLGDFAIFQGANSTLTAGNVNLSAATGEMIQDADAAIISSGTTTFTADTTSGVLTFIRNNDFNNLVASGNAMDFNDINALNIGSGGITSSDNVNITTAGNLTQTGALDIAGNLSLNAGTSNIVLTNANNALNNIAGATGANISITDVDDLALGSVFASGNVNILASNGTLTFNDGGLPITLNGVSTQTVTLVADNFTNNYAGGSTPINVGAGSNSRWLFYLNNLSGNDFGSGANALVSGNQAIWGTSYPTAVALSGNRYVFGTPETLTLTPLSTPFNVDKEYGDLATIPSPSASNYQVSGFINASLYGNVFTQDTTSNVSISGLSYVSMGSSTAAGVSGSPYDILMMGTGSTNTGYGVSYSNVSPFGTITITPAPLIITANDASRSVNTPNPVFTVTYTGLKNDDTSSVVSGLVVSSPATTSSPVGDYPIIPSSGTAANYTISYVNGVLTIVSAPTPTPTTTVPNNNPQVNPAVNADIINNLNDTIVAKPPAQNILTDETENNEDATQTTNSACKDKRKGQC